MNSGIVPAVAASASLFLLLKVSLLQFLIFFIIFGLLVLEFLLSPLFSFQVKLLLKFDLLLKPFLHGLQRTRVFTLVLLVLGHPLQMRVLIHKNLVFQIFDSFLHSLDFLSDTGVLLIPLVYLGCCALLVQLHLKVVLLEFSLCVNNDLSDAHVWVLPGVASFLELVNLLDIVPGLMLDEQSDVNDDESRGSADACRAIHEHFVALVVN